MGNDEINISVKIKYRTLIIGISLTIILAIIYLIFIPLDKTKTHGINDIVNTVIQIMGIGIAVTSLIYIAANQHFLLKSQQEQNQLELRKYSSEIMKLWSSKEISDYSIVARMVWQQNKDKTENDIVKAICDDENYYVAVIGVLNFLDWIGQLVKDNVVDETMIKKYYYVVFRTYKERFSPLILHIRKEFKSDLVLNDFMDLEKKWDSEKV